MEPSSDPFSAVERELEACPLREAADAIVVDFHGEATSEKQGMALGNERLVAAVRQLIDAFRAKGREFGAILKMGRTQLQDAVPMTLGQEFNAFAETLAGEIRALDSVQRVIGEVNMDRRDLLPSTSAVRAHAIVPD